VYDFGHRKERKVRKDSLNCLVPGYNKIELKKSTTKMESFLMINKTSLRTYAIPLSLVLFLFAIAFSGCLDNTTDCPGPPADLQPNVDISDTLPPVKNSTEMRSIIPGELPGTWEHSNNYCKDGMVTMIFKKPGNHRATIIVVDKRTARIAEDAVTPCNFSDKQGGITWELSETKFNQAPAMKGTYMVDDTLMGELIAYPHGRYLVVSYIIGENDKIVDMSKLMEALRFT
jgi:hypothetical protein